MLKRLEKDKYGVVRAFLLSSIFLAVTSVIMIFITLYFRKYCSSTIELLVTLAVCGLAVGLTIWFSLTFVNLYRRL